jgi:hypothetical protein
MTRPRLARYLYYDGLRPLTLYSFPLQTGELKNIG